MLSMGKSTISMVIFHSKLLVYQRVIPPFSYAFPMGFPMGFPIKTSIFLGENFTIAVPLLGEQFSAVFRSNTRFFGGFFDWRPPNDPNQWTIYSTIWL